MDFTAEYRDDDYDVADAPGYDDLMEHYEAMLNDCLDTWGANKPFGVYWVMNHLRSQVWNQRRQVTWAIENRLEPQRARLQGLIDRNQGDEISSVNIQNSLAFCETIVEEIRVYKMCEEIAVRVYDGAVDRFNNMPIDDNSERVFAFTKMDAPSGKGEVRKLDAGAVAGQEFLDKTEDFGERVSQDAKVDLGLSELAKGLTK